MNGSLYERLIEVTARLKESVVRLHESYQRLPAVIDREHRAIKAGHFPDVEAAKDEKVDLGSRIEDCFAHMTRLCDEIAQLAGTRPQTLKETCTVLATLLGVDDGSAAQPLAAQILRHQLEGLSRAAEDLAELAGKVKPILEANRILVTEMMHNYRESYRFWQEVNEQIESSYTPEGVQKVVGRNSGFRAKA